MPSLALGATPDSGLKAELDTIYQQLLLDPSDRALNRRMVEIAVDLGDYDAAIGAVERLIFYEPGNASLQLEAARLYAAIKSYAAAAGYLKDVLELPLSEDQRREAYALLAEAERATRPPPWSGFGQVGVRYQSNANNGSLALGLNEPFPFEKPVSDWNSFALGTLGLTEQINKNVAFEATLSGYVADQARVNRLDLGFAELMAGIRVTSDDEAFSVKPYAVFQGILLGNDPYQSAIGGGATARWTYTDGWWIEPQVEFKDRDYYRTRNYTSAPDQSGQLATYALNARGEWSEDLGWTSRVAYNRNRAVTDYQSYDQYFANLGFQVRFDGFGIENWLLSPFAGVVVTDFRGIAPPETFAGLATVREDVQWTIGTNLEVPLHERAALGVALEYSRNISNLDRNDFDNLKVTIGPQGRF